MNHVYHHRRLVLNWKSSLFRTMPFVPLMFVENKFYTFKGGLVGLIKAIRATWHSSTVCFILWTILNWSAPSATSVTFLSCQLSGNTASMSANSYTLLIKVNRGRLLSTCLGWAIKVWLFTPVFLCYVVIKIICLPWCKGKPLHELVLCFFFGTSSRQYLSICLFRRFFPFRYMPLLF